jgi:histidinol-phosphatase (PHP family)
MPFMFPQTDAHVHPDFSIDAEGSIDEYCDRALEIGLSEIIFATHVDTNKLYPHETEMVVDGVRVLTGRDSVLKYADAVWRAKEKYYDLGLMVKCGVEIDFYPELDRDFLKLFEDRQFEYVLVGIHRIGDLAIGYKDETEALYRNHDVAEVLRRYYEVVRNALEFDVFDAIAHLDYYRRFAPIEKMPDIMRVDYDFIGQTIEAIAASGMAIEVNTSAIRHGFSEYYPSNALLAMARKAGVRIRYLGSDSHKLEHIATDFENAEIIIYETNLCDIQEG